MTEDYYIGNFLIEMFSNIEEYRNVYGKLPYSVAVDRNHYELIKKSPFSKAWFDKESMQLKNGVFVVMDERFMGSFTSFRSSSYKRKE